jgi:hypothetical protein
MHTGTHRLTRLRSESNFESFFSGDEEMPQTTRAMRVFVDYLELTFDSDLSIALCGTSSGQSWADCEDYQTQHNEDLDPEYRA